jgi:hypothetical protein
MTHTLRKANKRNSACEHNLQLSFIDGVEWNWRYINSLLLLLMSGHYQLN